MTINQRLFSIMAEKGIKHIDLSRGTGIKANTISDWQTKGTNPQVDKIARICDFLNISCDYLITGNESDSNLNSDEAELISEFRTLDLKGKSAVMQTILTEQERIKLQKNTARNTNVG